MMYDLPTSVDISGAAYNIRSDYRATLDICAALTDPELSDQEKALVALDIFYPQLELIPHGCYQEALDRCFWFIDGGEDAEQVKAPRLMDWEQDFKYLVAPINRVMGKEIRAIEYLHWWTFISAYYEIGGECLFAQIVSIRDKLANGKKMEKAERAWYRRNRHLVDFKSTYTNAENETLVKWGAK